MDQLGEVHGTLGELDDAGTHILAALGVVRGQRRHRLGPQTGPLLLQQMELRRRDTETIRGTTHLLQRDEAAGTVERGVLHALGHDGTTHLRETDLRLGVGVERGDDEVERIPPRGETTRHLRHDGRGDTRQGEVVRAVHRHGGHQLGDGGDEILFRHTRTGGGEVVAAHGAGQAADLRGQLLLRHLPLELVHGHLDGGFVPRRPGVLQRQHRQRILRLTGDEHAVQLPQGVVPRGAVDGETRIEGLVDLEDLLHDEPTLRADDLPQTVEVAEGVGQAVRVVDADTVDEILGDELAHDAVRVLEHHRILLADTRQPVDREETTVGDHAVAPVHEAVVLLLVHLRHIVVEGDVIADGEDVVVVGQDDLAVLLAQLQLVDVLRGPQHRHAQLAAGAVVGVPVDVEVVLELRFLPVLEHVPPPLVQARVLHTEVVGDDVDDEPQPRFMGGGGQLTQTLHAAQLRVDFGGVGDVVVVARRRVGGEDGGEVDVTDAQGLQVGDLGGRLGETEGPSRRVRLWSAQLQTVGGGDRTTHGTPRVG